MNPETVADENRRYLPLLRDVREVVDSRCRPIWVEVVDTQMVEGWDGRPLVRVGPERGLLSLPSPFDYEGFDREIAEVCARHHFQEPTPTFAAEQGIPRVTALDARGATLQIWLGQQLLIYVDVPVKE